MKKTFVLLLALFLVVLSLHACAEDDQSAALTIGCFPPESCGRYAEFVPDEDTQNRLLDLLTNIDFIDWSHDDRAFPDYKEVSLGISISYNGFNADLRTGGWIRRGEIDGLGIWFAQDKELVDLVMELLSGYGFELFDPSEAKPIVSAELCDGPYYTGKAHEPIVLSDQAELEKLQKLVGRSKLSEPSGCPFGYAKLIINDSEGVRYELYPATDSCCQFFINGYFFNYDPSHGDDEHDTNQTLFDLFGVEPMNYYHNLR